MNFPEPLSFQWDKGNTNKNQEKHKVLDSEAEEAFLDLNRVVLGDVLHSEKEERYILIGKTLKDRVLFIVFTVRSRLIRIISARDLNKKEEILYKEYEKTA